MSTKLIIFANLKKFALSRVAKVDLGLLIVIVILSITGLAQIFSSTYFFNNGPSELFFNQILFTVLGFIVFFIISAINLDRTINSKIILFIAISILALLVLVLVAGSFAFEARRWITIGGFTIQPSEFVKLATILIISFSISQIPTSEKNKYKFIFLSSFFTITAVCLVFLQKSLGNTIFLIFISTSLVFANLQISKRILLYLISIAISVLFSFDPLNIFLEDHWTVISIVLVTILTLITIWVRLFYAQLKLQTIPTSSREDKIHKLRKSIPIYIIIALSFVFSLNFFFILQFSYNNLLQPFQRARIESFLDNSPENNQTTNYNRDMAITAYTSGGMIGNGFLRGRLTNSGYLPFAYTDFAFASFFEQMGLIWSFTLIFIYIFLFFRISSIWKSTKNLFLKNIVLGVGVMLFLNTYQHIGMNIGILPITGVPLPFLSYGGSALITVFIGLGLVSSVDIYNKENI